MKAPEYTQPYNKETGVSKEERKGCWLLTAVLLSIALWILILGAFYLIALIK